MQCNYCEMKSNISDFFAHGEASLSVRYNHPEQIEDIEKKIKQLVKRYGRTKHRIEIEGSVRRPPMVKTEPVEKIWTRVKSLADKLDYRLTEEHRWSSADICFVGHEKSRIDGLGAIGTDRAGEDEFILRHSLLERATLLAMLLYDLSKDKIK